MNKSTRYIILGAIVVVLVALFVWYKAAPGPDDGLANYLTSSGVKMYGAFWCPHCQAEKQDFGKSESKLPYIECSEQDEKTQTPICIAQKIQSYPTWDFPNPITLAASDADTKVSCDAKSANAPDACAIAATGSWVLTTNNLQFLTPSEPTLANGSWTLPPHSRTSGTVAPDILAKLSGYTGK